MPDLALPTQDRVEAYCKELHNWGRWGHNDQLGTLHLITLAKPLLATMAYAVRLEEEGQGV